MTVGEASIRMVVLRRSRNRPSFVAACANRRRRKKKRANNRIRTFFVPLQKWEASSRSFAALANLAENKKLFYKVVPPDQSFDKDYAGIFRFRFWRSVKLFSFLTLRQVVPINLPPRQLVPFGYSPLGGRGCMPP